MAEQHLDRNPRIGKAFQIRRHRLLEIDLSLAGQHQHRRSGDRLGDGSQLKTGRNRQFFPRSEVGIPVRLGKNLVPLGKEHHAVELSANSPGGKVLVDLFGLILSKGWVGSAARRWILLVSIRTSLTVQSSPFCPAKRPGASKRKRKRNRVGVLRIVMAFTKKKDALRPLQPEAFPANVVKIKQNCNVIVFFYKYLTSKALREDNFTLGNRKRLPGKFPPVQREFPKKGKQINKKPIP